MANKKLAQIAEISQPRYLSMVKSPANRSPFKIIRSDEEHTIKKDGTFVATRTRRMDSDNGMLYISLPTDFTEAQAQEVLVNFGLEEDYEIQMDEDKVMLVRSDMVAKDMPSTVAIRLDDNSVAHVAEASFDNTKTIRNESKIAGAVLTGIEFEGHSDEDVKNFLKEHKLEVSEENIERIDDETFYIDYKNDNPDLKKDRISLAEGVNARVYRAEKNDIPETISRGIVEACYGNYGYGQLDFYASLADELYTDAAYGATNKLGNILTDITIYSGLNLNSRIDLMNNALSQYGYYMAELMNSLPRSVVSVMTSDISKTSDKEDTHMAGETKKEDTTTEEVKRSDAVVEEKVEKTDEVEATETQEVEAARSDETKADATEESTKEENLKRSDVKAMIDDAVAAAVEAIAARQDKPAEKETEAKATEEAETEEAEPAKREDDAISTLADSVKALAEKVEEMGDTSVVRYDNGAAGTENSSVFRGSIFGAK